MFADPGNYLARAERFFQELYAGDLRDPFPGAALKGGSHDYDRKAAIWKLGLDSAAQFLSAHDWHLDVSYQEIRRSLPYFLQCSRAVASALGLMTCALQAPFDHERAYKLVIHDQDPHQAIQG